MDSKQTLENLKNKIIEIERTNSALQKSEIRYRNIVESSPMGMHFYELQDDGRLVFTGANPAADRLLGLDNSTFIGQNIEEAFPPLAHTEIPFRYRHVAKTGEMWRTEHVHYEDNKITGAFDVVAFQTEPNKIVVLFNNITERKQSEERLRKSEERLRISEERYRTLSDNLPVGVLRAAERGAVLHVNPALMQMLEIGEKQDISALNAWDFYCQRKDREYILNEIARHDQITEFECQLKSVRNKKIWVSISARGIKDDRGSIKFVDGIIQDITERKLIKEEKDRLQNQLIQAHKMEAIGTLAAGIAHDFNNVLWGILGFSEMALIQFESEPAKAKHSIERVVESGNRAKYIVQQILQFSRQSKISIGPLDITIVTKEVVRLLQATIPSNFELRLNIPEGSFTVHADPTQIHQVLMNLCTNAYHAMRDMTKGVLSIALERIQAESKIICHSQILNAGAYIGITISDTGHGIEPEYLEKIFDPYYTTKQKEDGTGLGLAVSFGIIKSFGGGIRVESQKEKGSTFLVYLPLKDDEIVQTVSVDEEVRGGTERILFVDDECAVLEIMVEMLQEAGYSMTGFNNSLEALEYFSSHPDQFDLIISDQTMPRMTGLELANNIRKISAVPIILCTGFSETITKEDVKNSGISLILKKPQLRKELTDAIRSVLDGTS